MVNHPDPQTNAKLDEIRKELIPIMQRYGVTHFFYVIEDGDKDHFDVLSTFDVRRVLTKFIRMAAQALERVQEATIRAYNPDGSSEPVQG